jgi:putative intracellular protease/amidase
MHIVIPLFDRFAPLDAIGPYQVLKLLPDTQITFAAERLHGVSDESGACTIQAQASLADVPRPDIILVPGGAGQADHMTPGPLQDWLIEIAQRYQLAIEYDPRPPFDGSPLTAPASIVAPLRSASRFGAHGEQP